MHIKRILHTRIVIMTLQFVQFLSFLSTVCIFCAIVGCGFFCLFCLCKWLKLKITKEKEKYANELNVSRDLHQLIQQFDALVSRQTVFVVVVLMFVCVSQTFDSCAFWLNIFNYVKWFINFHTRLHRTMNEQNQIEWTKRTTGNRTTWKIRLKWQILSISFCANDFSFSITKNKIRIKTIENWK